MSTDNDQVDHILEKVFDTSALLDSSAPGQAELNNELTRCKDPLALLPEVPDSTSQSTADVNENENLKSKDSSKPNPIQQLNTAITVGVKRNRTSPEPQATSSTTNATIVTYSYLP